MKNYSAVAGAVLAAGGSAEAAVVWSGPLNLQFGDSFGDQSPVMQGALSEFHFTGKVSIGFWVAAAAPNAGVLAIGALKYPLLGTVAANSSSIVAYGINEPNAVSGFFYTSVPAGAQAGEWDTDGESLLFAFRIPVEDTEDDVCYGWAEVQRIDSNDGRILQWAYDCEGPIKVGEIPEPGAMGLFALGAAGLAAFRRRRSKS